MTFFLAIAALLLVAALAAILVPLLKSPPRAQHTTASDLSLQVLRGQLDELDNELGAGTLDPAQHAIERAEIERRAIEDGQPAGPATVGERRPRWLALGAGVAVIALSVGLYLALGSPAALTPAADQGNAPSDHAVSPQQIQAMVAKLAERLQDNPNDGEGWLMLARSYTTLGRFAEAAAAFGRATSLLPADAQLLADYADTLAMAQGRSLVGEPEKIIQRALAADPKHLKALALAGSAAFERRDYAAAIEQWRKILALVPSDSGVAVSIRNSIADAEARSGKVAERPATTIRGVVALDDALRGQVGADATVFVYALPVAEPRMPLAVVRMTVAQLPAQFTLDDSKSVGGGKLSDHRQVIVGARISRSGDATPRSGDIEGFAEPGSKRGENVRITISRVVQ